MLTLLDTQTPPAARDAPLAERELARLVEEHGPAVLRLARSYLKDTAQAEDVFQDVFLRAYRSAASLREPQAARTWLLSVTANRCRDVLRSWARRHVVPTAELPEVAVELEPGGLDVDTELVAAVFALPTAFREVVLLHYYEELAPAEIARVLGVPTVTVRTRLHRARGALRRSLSGEVVDE